MCGLLVYIFISGAQSVLTYATVSSHIIGWDLRCSSPAWLLRNDPRHGLVTSLAVNRSQCWLAAGTCMGTVVCWDMRFRMPINKIQHPSGTQHIVSDKFMLFSGDNKINST